jgi:thymidylate synthase
VETPVSKFDLIYSDLVRRVIKEGVSDSDQDVRPRWADGTPAYTKSLISEKIVLNADGEHEVPLLSTKQTAWKTAIKEMLRFYVERTSNVEGLKIWDEWKRPDGTIGKSYGYQLGKPIIRKRSEWIVEGGFNNISTIMSNQVHNLIYGLKNDPASRRHIISLWNIDDLWDMSLYPCVWHNQWLVKQNKLHLIVGIRSNDLGLGNPFNVFQYYVLQRMVAQVTGYEIGSLIFNINDAHVYDRHIEPLSEQIEREPYEAPELWVNPDIKNFDDFTIDDFKIINYKYHPSVPMEVSI